MSGTSTATPGCEPGFFGLVNCGVGQGAGAVPETPGALEAAIGFAFALFGAQLLGFVLLRLKLKRIYSPRSYLVPERFRVSSPPGGLVGWLYPLFTTTNLTLIQKCGLDAYFFLRYLRMMLKIFFPIALLSLPVLLPVDATGGGGFSGLEKYSISNIANNDGIAGRLWGHLIVACLAIFWVFFVTFQELRGYIRVRQAYLTSPQHRIRASATTVLVAGIPQKWLTFEALSGLFDVYPGGIRNIWINRNYDDLADKVKYRNNVAKNLESAETNLIKLCRKKHEASEKKVVKERGVRTKKKTKLERQQEHQDDDAAAQNFAEGKGMSAGQQHGMPQGMQDMLDEEERQQDELRSQSNGNPFGIVGHGVGLVGQGLGTFGKGIGKLGGKVVGDVDAGFHKVGQDFDRVAETANTGGILGLGAAFDNDDSLYQGPVSDLTASQMDAAPSTRKPHGLESDPSFRHAHKRSDTHKPQANVQPAPRAPNPFAAGIIFQNAEHAQNDSPTSGAYSVSSVHLARQSRESRPKMSFEIQEPQSAKRGKLWDVFRNHDTSLVVPSPQPHVAEDRDEFPLEGGEKVSQSNQDEKVSKSKLLQKWAFWKKGGKEQIKTEYPNAYNKEFDEDQDGKAAWRQYIEPKDRETMRLPVWSWFIALPFIGKKVDKIYYLRRELARMNLEIEADQNDIEKYPVMNSAFIQFNHQVAAHMCCQSLSHHVPLQMAPRMVEISPDDVIWDNMAIKWWERYLRTLFILIICAGLIILYIVPVGFTSVLSQVQSVTNVASWLQWLERAPAWVKQIIAGILPPLLLQLLLLVVPIIFRLLIKQSGVPAGNLKELEVQKWYFAFLFIQVFFVATIAGGLASFITSISKDPTNIPQTLAKSLPQAAGYFFSLLTVQALSNSAGGLLQTFTLFIWFIWAPISDSTPRQKWRRQTNLSNVQWGSFFPVFTNFAVIGIIYSCIAPLILVFVLFVFSLFWIVYRFNILYVNTFTTDTGGRLFPVAINQLFVGIYFMEICLIGLFFTLTGEHDKTRGLPQAIIMIVLTLLTIAYQIIVNYAFSPFYQYLPITLEDEAVMRDEEFARAQASRFAIEDEAEAHEAQKSEEILTEEEEREDRMNDDAEDPQKVSPGKQKRDRNLALLDSPRSARRPPPSAGSDTAAWHHRARQPLASGTDALKKVGPEAVARLRYLADGKRKDDKHQDVEAQTSVGDILYSGYADDLEDLTPEERDLLVRYAFQHSALRARRPVVWIPRDRLGVSDDEIKRAERMSTVEIDSEPQTTIWMSNEGTALDHKCRVVFRRNPPDFSNVDLIAL